MADLLIAKQKLSASVDGRPIKVAANASPGTDIHQALAGVAGYDEIWLWAYNSSAAQRTLTLQWGGVTAVDDDQKFLLPPGQGGFLVAPGWVLRNSLLVKAYADTANVVTLQGFVNRIA